MLNFNVVAGAGVYLHTGSAPVLVPPLSMAAMFEPTALVDGTIGALNRSPAQGFADFEHWTLETVTTGGTNYITANQAGPGFTFGAAQTPVNSIVNGQVNFAAGVFPSNSSRVAYCNGTKATDSTVCAAPLVGDLQIGSRLTNSGTFRPMIGCQGWFAFWNIDLTDGAVAALQAGISPLRVNRGNLMVFAPMLNNATKTVNLVSGGPALTAVATGSSTFLDCPASGPRIGVKRRIPQFGPIIRRNWLGEAGPIRALNIPPTPPLSGEDYFGGELDGWLGDYEGD